MVSLVGKAKCGKILKSLKILWKWQENKWKKWKYILICSTSAIKIHNNSKKYLTSNSEQARGLLHYKTLSLIK